MKVTDIATKPRLQGCRVILRPPQPSDAAWRMALGRHPEIVRMFGGAIASWEPMDADDARRWVTGLLRHPHAWIIEADNCGIGEIRLDALNAEDETARLAIGIFDPAMLGKAYGTEATRLALSHAFDTLKLHRISLRVLDFNARAIACYRRCGFRIEGREREACRIGNARHDDIIMGILSREFAPAA